MDIVLKAKKNTRKGGKKGRKIGRNKKCCERYRAAGTRAKNKAKRAIRVARQKAKKSS
jgi:hypothetical protein